MIKFYATLRYKQSQTNRTVVRAHLTPWSLTVIKDLGLNPVIGSFDWYCVNCLSNKANRSPCLGREPSSKGYGRRLMSERLWVQTPVPDTRWIIFHIFVVKLDWCLKRLKINEKEAGNGLQKTEWKNQFYEITCFMKIDDQMNMSKRSISLKLIDINCWRFRSKENVCWIIPLLWSETNGVTD